MAEARTGKGELAEGSRAIVTHCPVTPELGEAPQRRLQCGVSLIPVGRPMSALVGFDSAAGCPAWKAAACQWGDDAAPAGPGKGPGGAAADAAPPPAHSAQWRLSGLGSLSSIRRRRCWPGGRMAARFRPQQAGDFLGPGRGGGLGETFGLFATRPRGVTVLGERRFASASTLHYTN